MCFLRTKSRFLDVVVFTFVTLHKVGMVLTVSSFSAGTKIKGNTDFPQVDRLIDSQSLQTYKLWFIRLLFSKIMFNDLHETYVISLEVLNLLKVDLKDLIFFLSLLLQFLQPQPGLLFDDSSFIHLRSL